MNIRYDRITTASILDIRIDRCRAYFTRYGCRASIIDKRTGALHDELRFYGSDGRMVRAEAHAWATARSVDLYRLKHDVLAIEGKDARRPFMTPAAYALSLQDARKRIAAETV